MDRRLIVAAMKLWTIDAQMLAWDPQQLYLKDFVRCG